MDYQNLVFDANNLFWRSTSTCISKFITYEDVKLFIGGIQEFLKRVKEIQETYGRGDSTVYFLFDNPFSQINIRKIISEGKYKHPRKSKQVPEEIYKSLSIITEILRLYSDNFILLKGDNLEADDLTYPLKKYLDSLKNGKTLFISADLDWSRNIDENNHWFNFQKIYTISDFKEDYGFSPEKNRVKLWKAIRGDQSDNIDSSVPYLPKDFLLHILETYQDVEDLFKRIRSDKFLSKAWIDKIILNKDKIRVNYQLVDFIPVEKPIEQFFIPCQREPKQSRLWFSLLELPTESWMETAESVKGTFFKRNKTI